MHINTTIGNILHKNTANKPNILYHEAKNCIDYTISLLPISTFCLKTTRDINIINNTTFIGSVDANMFQYGAGLYNNLIEASTDYENNTVLGTNTITMVHGPKPNQIKKEDLYLLNSKLANTTKIVFTPNTAQSWKINNKIYVMKYGVSIPDVTHEKKNKMLVFNMDNKNISIVENLLRYKKIEYDVASVLDDNLIKSVGDYKACLEMVESNVYNAIYASACGCNVILPSTEFIAQNYADIDNMYLFNSMSDLTNAVDKAMNFYAKPHSMLDKYSFETFSSMLTEVLQQSSKEVCYI